MDDLEGTIHDSIYAEFADIKSILLNYETATSLEKDDVVTTGLNLLNQACYLGLIDILEAILPYFHALVIDNEYRGQVLYDCIAIAHEHKHDDVVRILLEFSSKKNKCVTVTSTTDELPKSLTLLQCAASHADVEIIKMLINSGVDVNQTNDRSETALHYACDAVTANFLINNSAVVNVVNTENKTPLFFACTTYRMGVIRTLLDNGAKPDLGLEIFPQDIVCQWSSDQSIASAILQTGDDQETANGIDILPSCVWRDMHETFSSEDFWEEPYPFCTSCKHENQLLIQASEVRKELRRDTTTHEYPPLHMAITNYYVKYTNQLVEDMDEINAIISQGDVSIVNALDTSGATALYHAAGKNLIEVATFLLNSGADPNLTTSGKYPLVVACRFSSQEFVELLLNRGADPNVVDSYDASPLLIAVRSLDQRVVEMLVEHGADVNHRNREGITARSPSYDRFNIINVTTCKYHQTVQNKIATFLIDNGFDFNTALTLYTVTFSCVSRDIFNYQLFELLLARGADMKFINSELNTVTQIPFVVRELLRRGWKPNQPDGYGRNLLAIACAHFNVRCARLLLAAGADPNLVTWDSFVDASNSHFSNDNVEAIDFLFSIGVKFNVSNENELLCLPKPPKVITLRDFFVPFCKDTKCIVRLLKAGANLKILTTLCRRNLFTLPLPTKKITCSSAGCMCKAIILAGYKVKQQQDFVELLRDSKSHHARDLASWLEDNSTNPPSLLRLSRTVIRRQLLVASGYRTILPTIDLLPIANVMHLYLKFEGPFSEIDLSEASVRPTCEFCNCMNDTVTDSDSLSEQDTVISDGVSDRHSDEPNNGLLDLHF